MANSVKCIGVAGLDCDKCVRDDCLSDEVDYNGKCVRDEVHSAFGEISD